jgi:hypothetical protein
VDFAENFEDLKIWQRARALANELYGAMAKCRDFDFRSQSQREAGRVGYRCLLSLSCWVLVPASCGS